MRVLVVEDDSSFRLILKRAVSQFGHECELAQDGVEGWEMFQRSPADVVISDWVMPRLTGPELCRKIRGREDEPYTYIVLLTALDDKRHFVMGMQAGADDYLTKPLDLDELQVRLLSAARVTTLHRRLAEQNAELERLLQEQARLHSDLSDMARARGQLEGVTLATREVTHLLTNDLMLTVAAIDLLQARADLPTEAVTRLEQALDGLNAADGHLKKLQQVVRVETKETPVGPSLDLDRSTGHAQR